MSLIDLSIAQLLKDIGAKSPTPGGGAVTPVVGAIACALTLMVIEYSVGKKSLAAHQAALNHDKQLFTKAQALFIELAEADAEAYGRLNELLRLDAQEPRRTTELPGVVRDAVQIPMSVIAACCDLLSAMENLAGRMNRHLRSDLAIAAELLEAAARASRWNVSINQSLWNEAGLEGDPVQEVSDMLDRAADHRGRIVQVCA